MKTKILITLSLLCFITAKINSQSYQTFPKEGFKIKCKCELYENLVFKKMAKQQGIKNIVNAYVCAENKDNPNIGAIYNINIYKVSMNENIWLNQYANDLKKVHFDYSFTKFQGARAIEYEFSQFGLSTKAIVFLKDEKSYLIQVATRKNLVSKFNNFKSSFYITK